MSASHTPLVVASESLDEEMWNDLLDDYPYVSIDTFFDALSRWFPKGSRFTEAETEIGDKAFSEGLSPYEASLLIEEARAAIAKATQP